MKSLHVWGAVVSLLVASIAWSQQGAFRIVVIEGEDAVNIIMQNTAVQPIVEVRDRNDLPVAGASVVFLINGRGAQFANGARQLAITTDAAGRATTTGLTGVSRGAVQIQVRATFQNQVATTTINQTNFTSAAEAAQAGRTPGPGNNASNAGSGSGGAGGATGAAAAGAAGAGAGAAAAGAGTTAGGIGLSTGAIAGIGAAAVGGVVVATKVAGGDSNDTQSDCTSQANALNTAVTGALNACSGIPSVATCEAALQTELNALGAICTCLGPSRLQNDAATKQALQDTLADAAAVGFNVTAPQSCLQ